MSHVVVDAPRSEGKNVPLTVLALTSPILYVRMHGRNAGTWNARGGSAAERFDYLYSDEELGEWVPQLKELSAAGGAGVRGLQQQQPQPHRRPGRSSGADERGDAPRRARGREGRRQPARFRSARRISLKRSGASTLTTWPAPSTTSNRASGADSAI